ncbi:MAG: hypothetical protein Q9221_003918 [Calogaya cf. arnoldii]
MAPTLTLSSPTAAIISVVNCPTKDLDDAPPRQVPYGGDIHKLRDDIFDAGLEAKYRAEDARIRGLPAWSSIIANPTATQVRFKYQANGRYLEFLSLFLTGERQVDISFSRRHALIVFLVNGLEECHSQYVRRRIPEEFERLQMISSDELELQVWQAFIRATHLNLGVRNYATDEDRKTYKFFEPVNRIRQLAIHRTSTYKWNFDTRIIKGAAACAQYLGDDALVAKIELLVKVLYVDASGVSEYAVTDDERNRAYNLLWPTSRQPETTHQLLEKVQNLAEKSSYGFCQRHLPKELAGFECTAAEHFELSQWRQIIMYRCHSTEDEDSFAELDMKLQKADVSLLRNAASHRECLVLYSGGDGFYDDSGKLKAYMRTAKAYVRALGDEKTALEIETLKTEVLSSLSKRYNDDWLDPQWCDNRDLELIRQSLERKRLHWDRLHRWFWDSMEVNISPLLPLYGRAEVRLNLLGEKLRLNDTAPGSSQDAVGGETSCESAAELPIDRLPWPSLADLEPLDKLSYEEVSSSSTNPTNYHDEDTDEGDDEGTRDGNADDVEDIEWVCSGVAAGQGIAVGCWNSEHDDVALANADSTDEDTDQGTDADGWDTDETADTDETDDTDETADTNDTEDFEWLCPDPAADRGVAVGGWNNA